MSDRLLPLKPGTEGDKQMLRNPDLWPLYPRLPMKRMFNGVLQTGVIVEHHKLDPMRPSVFLSKMFDEINVTTSTCLAYQSIDDVFEDGWRID